MPPRARPATTRRKTSSAKAPAKPKANGNKPLTIRVEDLSDTNEFKKILVVGDSGVGKTVLVGGAPRGIFISTEKGTISAKRFGSKAKLIKVANWQQLEEALNYVEEHADEYDWAMVDSLPKMQRMLRRYILDVNIEEQRKGADPDSLQIQDYDKWYNMFTRFYDRLNEMPINVLYTSTPMRVETEDDEGDPIDIVLPAIQGKAKEGYAIAQYICAEVDCLWYLNVERKKGKQVRVLITQKRPPYFAKDRYAALPGRVILPDNDPTLMSRLLAKLDSGEMAPPEADPEPEEDLEDDDTEEPEEDDDTDDDGEDSQEAHNRSVSRRRQRAKKSEPDTEEEPEDDEEEPEEEPAPRRKPAARKAASKRPTAKGKARSRKEPEPEEDEDDIDLDDDVEGDDDDYDND